LPPPTKSGTETGPVQDGQSIRAPMVGVFYRASTSDGPPFVEIGQTVKAGDTLCIIEAMKMMNQIQSDRAGTIKAILAENASPVEFDQPLFVIG
ncbi:acetyl-CoA carboxylase, biotin carboxyl carrier protein subunit, partial [mine drainage metagenome]